MSDENGDESSEPSGEEIAEKSLEAVGGAAELAGAAAEGNVEGAIASGGALGQGAGGIAAAAGASNEDVGKAKGAIGAASKAGDAASKVADGNVSAALGGAGSLLQGLSVIPGAGGVLGIAGHALEAAKGIVDLLGVLDDLVNGSLGEVEYHFTLDNLAKKSGNEGVTWTISSFALDEALNTPYRMWLELATSDTHANPLGLVGCNATVELSRKPCGRTFKGMVVRAETGGLDSERKLLSCRVEIVPAFALLKQRVDTRVFQNMSVPDILKQVLEGGLADYERTIDLSVLTDHPKKEFALDESPYWPREYAVQYHESDFDFASRLMEEEGFTYTFDHEQNDKMEVLRIWPDCMKRDEIETFDTVNKNLVSRGREKKEKKKKANTVPFVQEIATTGALSAEPVQFFQGFRQMTSTRTAIQAFDWTNFSTDKRISRTWPGDLDDDEYGHVREVYDLREIQLYGYGEGDKLFPDYTKYNIPDQARFRQQLRQRDANTYAGAGLVTGFKVGAVFELQGHPQIELDGKEYLIVRLRHSGKAGTAAQQALYRNEFECIPADTVYRPTRRTPKPRIESVQTAIVTGPRSHYATHYGNTDPDHEDWHGHANAEDVFTDEHGRVKVQFHWDRIGKRDEKSSCFLRVAQAWAGMGYGTFFLPRIGMEVLVSFLNGDPDRPLITGCVYNSLYQPPPSRLADENDPAEPGKEKRVPEHATRTIIRTRSIPWGEGGEGYNELSFEDSAEKEEILIRAQRNFREDVLHDHLTTVRNDRRLHVIKNRRKVIDENEETIVHGQRKDTVDKDENVHRNANRITHVKHDDTTTIDQNRTVTVAKLDKKKAKTRNVTIDTTDELMVGGSLSQHVKDHFTILSANVGLGSSQDAQDPQARLLEQGTVAKHTTSYLVLFENKAGLGAKEILNVKCGKEAAIRMATEEERVEIKGQKVILKTAETGQKASVTVKNDGTLLLSADTKIELQVGTTSLTLTKSGAKLKGVEVGVTADAVLELRGTVMREN